MANLFKEILISQVKKILSRNNIGVVCIFAEYNILKNTCRITLLKENNKNETFDLDTHEINTIPKIFIKKVINQYYKKTNLNNVTFIYLDIDLIKNEFSVSAENESKNLYEISF